MALAWILILALAKVFTKVEVVLLIRVGNVISIWGQSLFFSGNLQWSVIIERVIDLENAWICACRNDEFLRVKEFGLVLSRRIEAWSLLRDRSCEKCNQSCLHIRYY